MVTMLKSGLRLTKRQAVEYPKQVGAKGQYDYYTRHMSHTAPTTGSRKLAGVKDPKPGQYVWIWNEAGSMSMNNVAMYMGTHQQYPLHSWDRETVHMLWDGKQLRQVYKTQVTSLIPITKTQYLDVKRYTFKRKVLRRLKVIR